jgi:hypothetical protein
MPRRNLDDLRAMAAVAELAAAQHGVVSRRQAHDLGLSDGAIARARARGSWRFMHRGVAYLGSGEPGLDTRMWAAHLALDGAGVVAGRAAGLYWGLIPGLFGIDERVLMYVPRSMHLTLPGIRTRRVEDPAARAHPARVPPVLTVEHTVLDLVRSSVMPEDGVVVVLRACRVRRTTPARLHAAMAASRGFVGEGCWTSCVVRRWPG